MSSPEYESNQPNEAPVDIAGFYIGYGRLAFAENLAAHAQRAGIPFAIDDVLKYVRLPERIALQTAYQGLSYVPGIYEVFRSILDARNGPIAVDQESLARDFFDRNHVISVSPNATRILSRVPTEIWSVVGDRAVQRGDVFGNQVRHVFIASEDIYNRSVIPPQVKTHVVGGIVQPPGFMDVRHSEKHDRLQLGAQPHIMTIVNGSGLLDAWHTLRELSPLIKEKVIRYSVFVGHHGLTRVYVQAVAKYLDIPVRYGMNPEHNEPGVIDVYYAPTPARAVAIRNAVLPYIDISHPVTAQETSNVPMPVVVNFKNDRNFVEKMNALYGLNHGWLVSEQAALGQQVRSLITKTGSGPTAAQELRRYAVMHNDPFAGQRIVEAVQRHREQVQR